MLKLVERLDENGVMKEDGVRDLYYSRLMIQGSTTNPLSWQGNIDYRKSDLDYTTLGRTFRNFFSLQFFPCIHKYDDRENH